MSDTTEQLPAAWRGLGRRRPLTDEERAFEWLTGPWRQAFPDPALPEFRPTPPGPDQVVRRSS